MTQALALPSTANEMATPAQLSNQQLEQAFAAFNRVSDELGSAWRELENRVAHLSTELAAARSARLAELAEKERLADKLSTLMAALPGAVVVINADGVIEDCNPAAELMLGAYLPGCDWQGVLANTGEAPPEGNGEFDSFDQRRIAVAYSDLANADARIALLTDISESHRLSQLLHREERLRDLGDMAARLAHQLRTPLSSAMLYLSQLGQGVADEERAGRVSGRVRERLRQIEHLIECMLRYIRGGEEQYSELCLQELISGSIEALGPQLDRAGAELLLEMPEQDIYLRCQREALDNALSNLIDNAIQCCTGETRISVSLQQTADEVSIQVDDNGPGIVPELREQIFEPWFSDRPHGTGLGLAIVASAAQAHGGEILVTESAEGGSSFRLRLPASDTVEKE